MQEAIDFNLWIGMDNKNELRASGQEKENRE